MPAPASGIWRVSTTPRERDCQIHGTHPDAEAPVGSSASIRHSPVVAASAILRRMARDATSTAARARADVAALAGSAHDTAACAASIVHRVRARIGRPAVVHLALSALAAITYSRPDLIGHAAAARLGRRRSSAGAAGHEHRGLGAASCSHRGPPPPRGPRSRAVRPDPHPRDPDGAARWLAPPRAARPDRRSGDGRDRARRHAGRACADSPRHRRARGLRRAARSSR